MNRTKLAKAATASVLLMGLGAGSAVAVGAAPAPTPGQTLSSYMGGDAAQWDKVQTWVESEYGQGATETPVTPAPTPAPTTPPAEPSPEPTAPATGIESGKVEWTTTGVKFTGKIHGTKEGDRVQIRVDTKALTGQRGFYEYELVKADGTVSFTLADYTTPQDKLFWHIAIGGTELTYGNVVASGEVTKPTTTTPSPEPTAPATGEGTTGGSGGSKTNILSQSFTNSAGMTSQYRQYAEGLDWSKPVGLMMYTDGTGGYGYDNPNSPYLLAGATGMAATAKKHNMVLIVPVAPAGNCDGGDNCWFDNSGEQTVAQAKAKAKWSSDLMTKVKGQFDIDNGRIVIGGYSSGAQWTTRYFLPGYGEAQSVDLAVPIAYGGTPAGRTTSPLYPNFSQAFKDDVVISWDTGKLDDAYSTSEWASIGGYNWYKNNGFKTDYLWIDGEDHDRYDPNTMVGHFGPVMDREITQHLR